MHQNKILIGYQKCFQLRCCSGDFNFCLLFLLTMPLPKRRRFTNDDECAFVRAGRVFYLERERNEKKTHKICLRVFDWRFPMEKRSLVVRTVRKQHTQTHSFVHISNDVMDTVVLWHTIPMSGVTSNKKIGLESLNKCSRHWICSARERLSLDVSFISRTKKKNCWFPRERLYPFVLCFCRVYFAISAVAQSTCISSVVWRRKHITTTPCNSNSNITIFKWMPPKRRIFDFLFFFLSLRLVFESDNWELRAKTENFLLKTQIQSHNLTGRKSWLSNVIVFTCFFYFDFDLYCSCLAWDCMTIRFSETESTRLSI